MQAVKQVKSGASKDFREAKATTSGTAKKAAANIEEIEFGHLRQVWRRAGVRARKKFLAWVKEQPEGKAAGK